MINEIEVHTNFILYIYTNIPSLIFSTAYVNSKFDRRTRAHLNDVNGVGTVDAHYGIRLVDHGSNKIGKVSS